MVVKIPTVAIVGRTNVGKSTLFNAILGRRMAVVEDTPGVTRDRSYSLVTRYDFFFNLCDTGGIVGDEDISLQELVRTQAEIAIEESSLVIALFDGLEGITPLDEEVAAILRQSGKPVIWVVNKCEKDSTRDSSGEFYGLGVENILTISAAHRLGIRELVSEIGEELDSLGVKALERPPLEDRPIRVSLVGRPNVGKSSIINRITSSDRLVTAAQAGTTRDSIDVPVVRDGIPYLLIDTAGLRKRARVEDGSVERFSVLRTLRSIVRSDVVVLVLDASEGVPSVQESKIAALVHERGKGLVIVVNKWDAIKKDHLTVKAYERTILAEMPMSKYAPVLFVSALSGRRLPSILAKVKEVFEASQFRAQTADVNRILQDAFRRRPPPLVRGERIKLRFATQVGVAPPTFVLFLNRSWKVPQSYERYLKNVIRESYPFTGLNLKLQFRKARDEMQAEDASR